MGQLNAKDLKVKAERSIKSIVDKFSKETGLSVFTIRVDKSRNEGFFADNIESKVTIVLE